MTTLELTAKALVIEMAKTVNLTIAHRQTIEHMLVTRFQPLCVEQSRLNFNLEAEIAKSAVQCREILSLLKSRRSSGASNVELYSIAKNATARISELRRTPHNYRIRCARGEGRTFHYFLAAEDW